MNFRFFTDVTKAERAVFLVSSTFSSDRTAAPVHKAVTLDVTLELPADVVEYLSQRQVGGSPAGLLRKLIRDGQLAKAVGDLIASAESSRRGVEHHDLGLYGKEPETWSEFQERRQAERKAAYDHVVTLDFVKSLATPAA